jgi:hypothetical protein
MAGVHRPRRRVRVGGQLACEDLREQALPLHIQEITDAVDTARQKAEHGMTDAAHALNKAALIASDSGMTDLARHLCWPPTATSGGP